MNGYMNDFIYKEKAKVVESKESFDDELFIVIGLTAVLIIMMVVMNINVYDVIFKGIDAMNLAFRNMTLFISGLMHYLHLNVMVQQIAQLF